MQHGTAATPSDSGSASETLFSWRCRVASDTLPALAARTLSILIGLVLLCLVSLAPGQARAVVGIEILVIGLILTTVVLVTTLRNLGGADQARWRVSLVGLAIVGSVPSVIAGVSLVAGVGGGFYWLLAEFITGIIVGVHYGWILLIETRR